MWCFLRDMEASTPDHPILTIRFGSSPQTGAIWTVCRDWMKHIRKYMHCRYLSLNTYIHKYEYIYTYITVYIYIYINASHCYIYYSHNMQISCSFTCRIMKVLFSIYIVFGCIWSSLAAFKSLDRKQSQFQTLISGGLTFSTPQLVQPSPVARQRHQGFPRLGAKKRRTRPCSCESET